MILRIEFDALAPVPDGRDHPPTALAERVRDSAPDPGPLDEHCPPNLPLMAAAPFHHEMESVVWIVEVS